MEISWLVIGIAAFPFVAAFVFIWLAVRLLRRDSGSALRKQLEERKAKLGEEKGRLLKQRETLDKKRGQLARAREVDDLDWWRSDLNWEIEDVDWRLTDLEWEERDADWAVDDLNDRERTSEMTLWTVWVAAMFALASLIVGVGALLIGQG